MGVNLGTAVGYLDLDTSKFTMGFKDALSSVEKFKKGTGGVSGMLKGVGNSLASTGKDLTLKVTTPIVGLGAAAVKTSASFESSLSKVKAISGATGKDMDNLKAKAIEMGAKTKFSATEASDAFTYMAMAGWDAKSMMDGIDGIMNLAAADGLDLATTSDIVTDALTAFGLQASDSAHFADVLAKASSSANTNVSMLGESFKYVAPVAGSLGYSVEDTTTALGLMANSGIKASQAGTSLRAALTRMVKPTDEAEAIMERYHLTLQNSDGTMKSLGDVMDMLRSNMGSLSEAEQSQAASALFGQEAMSGMLAIINSSEGDYNKLTDAINNADGTAENMANTMQDNLNGQLTILKSNIESLAISLGDMIVPYIKKVADKIQQLVIYLNGLDDQTKQNIIRIAAVVAAIGPALMILGKVTSTVGTIISVVSKLGGVLGAAAGPIGIIIAAIAALYLAWKTNFAGIGDAINELAATLSEKFGEIVEHVKSIASKIKELWENDFGGIRTITETVIGVVVDVIKNLASIVSEVFGLIDSLINGDWNGVWEHFKNICKAAIDIFVKIFQGIVKVIATILSNVIKAVINFAKNIVPKMKEAASNAISNFIKFFKQLPGKIGNIIGHVLGTIVKFAVNIAAKGREAGKNFLNNIITFFKQLPGKVLSFLTKVIKNAINFAKTFPGKAKEAAKNFKDKLIDGVKGLPKKMLEIGKNIIDGIVNGIKNAWSNAKKAVSDFAGGIVDGFKDALGIHSPSRVMKEQVGAQIANGIIEGIKSKKDAAKKSAEELSNEILSAAEKKLDRLQTYNKISLAEEIAYWRKIYDSTKKGSDANLTAYKNYVSAKKSYNEELKALETEYKDKVTSVYDDLKAKVDELTKAYNDQVNSRKEALLSTFKLFDEYEISSDKNGEDLTNNLQSQVNALQQFNKQMSELEGRGILPQDLIDELRNQGIAATGELEALNTLTDEKLQQYADLWKQRNQLAQEEAERENKDAYDKLQKDLKEANSEALKKLDTLNTKYQKKIDKLKSQAYSAAKSAGKKTGQGIVDGINSKSAEIRNTLDGIVSTINSYMATIQSSLSAARSAATEISSISKSTAKASKASSKSSKKSHRQGLTYVPYDGYEAMLHEGEQVLTREEARSRGTGDTFIFNSPKAIDEKEAARQMKKAKQQMALGY